MRMKILVINPNTSESMTDRLRRELEQIRRRDTELTVLGVERGPYSIETAYDEAYAIPPMLDRVRQANTEGFAAVIIACFSDPGLTAAREISRIPVLGIEETSFHVAAMLGARFCIVTPRRERIATKRAEVHARGLDDVLASVRSLDLSVAETDERPEETKRRILETAKAAVEQDGAEVLILGCAGMTGYAREIQEKLGLAVIDPAAVTLKLAEAFADLGLVHSKIGLYSQPPQKPFK